MSIRVQIEGDQAVRQKIESLKQSLSGAGQSASQVQRPMSNLGKSFADVGNQTQGASKNIQSSSHAIQDVGKSVSAVSSQTMSTGAAFKQLGGAVQGSTLAFGVASSAAWNLYNAYDNLEKVELAASKSTLMVQKAQYSLSVAQETLNEYRQRGTESAHEMANAEEAVRIAQERLSVVSERNTIVQGDLQEAYAQFATQVGPQVIMMGSSMVQMFSNLFKNAGALRGGLSALATNFTGLFKNMGTANMGATQLAGSTRMVATSMSPLGGIAAASSASVTGFGTATQVASKGGITFTGALKSMGAGVKGFMLAIGPLGWIMIGVGALFTAIATNAFGFRDALNSVGKAIGDALPFLRPLLDGLKTLGQWIGLVPQEAEAASAGMEGFAASEEGAAMAGDDLAMTTEGVATGLNTVSASAGPATQGVEDFIKSVNSGLSSTTGGGPGGIMQQMDDLMAAMREIDSNPFDPQFAGMNQLYSDLQKLLVLGNNVFPQLKDLIRDQTTDSGQKLQTFAGLVDAIPHSFETLPAPIRNALQPVMDSLDELTLTTGQKMDVLHTILTGKVTAGWEALDEATQDALLNATQNLGDFGNVAYDDLNTVMVILDALGISFLDMSANAATGLSEADIATAKMNQSLKDLGISYDEDAAKMQGYIDALGLDIVVTSDNIQHKALLARAMEDYASSTIIAEDTTRQEALAVAMAAGEWHILGDILNGNISVAEGVLQRHQDLAAGMQQEGTLLDDIRAGYQENSTALDTLLQQMGYETTVIQGGIRERSILYDAITQGIEARTTEEDAIKSEAAAIAILNGDYQKAIELINGNVEAAQRFIDVNQGVAAELNKQPTILDQIRTGYEENGAALDSLLQQMGYESTVIQGNIRDRSVLYDAITQAINARTTEEDSIKAEAAAIALLNGDYQKAIELINGNVQAAKDYAAANQEVAASLQEHQTMIDDINNGYAEQAAQLDRLIQQLGIETDITNADIRTKALYYQASEQIVDSTIREEDSIRSNALAIEALNEGRQFSVDILTGSIDVIQQETEAFENSGQAAEDAAKQREEHAQAMAEFSPLIQEGAKAWGIYDNAMLASTATGQAMIQGLGHLQGEYDTMIGTAREIAVAQVGVQQAYQMTDEELVNFLVTSGDLNEAQKSIAETAQEQSQRFADAWMASFDSIKQGQQDFGNTMSSAISKMGQEFGEDMEVGLSDVEKKVSKGIQAFTQQFTEEIFPEDFIAAAIVKGNDPADIATELHDLFDDVLDEGLIHEDDAAALFNPFIDFIENDLPDDTEQAWGYLIGRMPHLIDQISPVIVNGVQVAGGEARAAMKTGLVDPLIAELGALETGASGVDVGRGLLTSVQEMMPQLQQEFPKIAGLLQQTLDNADLTADQKVQEIIATLGQISPAFAEQIMAMDKDGDTIGDIADDKILGPMEMMRLQALETGAAIALAFGNTEAYDILQGKINEIVGATSAATGSVIEDWEQVGETVKSTGFRMQGDLSNMIEDGWKKVEGASEDASQVVIESADGSRRAVFDFKTNTITYLGEAQGGYEGLRTAMETQIKVPAPDMSAWEARRKELEGVGGQFGVHMRAEHEKNRPGGGPDVSATATTATPPPPDFTQHKAAWDGYIAHVGNLINSTLMGHLTAMADQYVNIQQGTGLVLSNIASYWKQTVDWLGSLITGQHMGTLTGLANQYVNIQQGTGLVLSNIASYWKQTVNWLGSLISGQHMGVLTAMADQYVNIRNGIRVVLTQSGQAWNNFTSIVQSASSQGSSAVSRLASAVSSNMSRIVSSVNNASSAIRNLQSSISNLRDKTVTITTRHRTVGSPGGGGGGTQRAASGFSGVVTQPTRFFAGEGNRPEMVQVTPLSPNASGGVHMNKAAATTTNAMSNVFTQPTIRAGKSKSNSSKRRADSVIFFPDGTKAVFGADGNIKFGTYKNYSTQPGGVGVKNTSVKEKGIKGSTALTKNPEPKDEFSATGMARTIDPMSRRGPTGLTGRGGKSLIDMRYASGPNGAINLVNITPRGGVRWVISEKRYEDGSYRRFYNDGSVEIGRDVFRPNTRYVKSKLKEGKSVKDVKYFKNGVGVVTYFDGSEQKIKHNHPGPFEEGGKTKEDKVKKVKLSKKYTDMRYSTKAAKYGFEGVVTKPTQFMTGEGGKAEHVSIQPLQEALGKGGGGGGAGGKGGRPIEIHVESRVILNEREVGNALRKELLGGIYSMT